MNTTPDSKHPRERAEDAAAAWLSRQDSSQWTAQDQSAFDQWLAASPGHRVAYARARMTWRDTERLKSVSAGFPRGQAPAPGAIGRSPFFTLRNEEYEGAAESGSRRFWRVRSAWAAGILLALGAGALLYRTGWFVPGNTSETAVGGLATVPAADGSMLTLNTNSQVHFRFNDHERRVELERGEAFFDVAPDPQRPFIVDVGSQRITVVGTQFSARRDGSRLHVLVTDGKVRLEEGRSLFGSSGETRMAGAGTAADLGSGGIELKSMSREAMEQALGWRAGYVVFDRTPLAQAVAEFNRYNVRQMTLADAALGSIEIEGNFRPGNLDGFLRLLEQGFGIEATEVKQGRITLRKK